MLKELFRFIERPGNDMNADEFTDTAGRSRARFRRGFHRTDITTDQHGHEAVEKIFLSHQNNVCGFDHGIGCFNRSDETARFDHA